MYCPTAGSACVSSRRTSSGAVEQFGNVCVPPGAAGFRSVQGLVGDARPAGSTPGLPVTSPQTFVRTFPR